MSTGLDRGANVYRWEIEEGNIKIAVAVMNDGKIVLKLELPNTMEIVSVKGDYYEVIHSPIPVGKCPQMVLRVFETEHARRAREKSGQLRLDEPTPTSLPVGYDLPKNPIPGVNSPSLYRTRAHCDRCNMLTLTRFCMRCECDVCETCFESQDHKTCER